jgi:hypothetical protein
MRRGARQQRTGQYFYRSMCGVEVGSGHFAHDGEESPERRFVFDLVGRLLTNFAIGDK